MLRRVTRFVVCTSTRASSTAKQARALQKTALHDLHVEHGGKMVDYAGYSMPLQYASQTVLDSHKHVRSACGVFDVSHMMQVYIRGADRFRFMNSLTVADVSALGPEKACLSLYTNEDGGIRDDLIVTNAVSDNALYVVSNAGCAEKILPYLQTKCEEFTRKGYDVSVQLLDNPLLAVQGPAAHEVIQAGIDFPVTDLDFLESRKTEIFKLGPCRVTRCGYTGEDGVEISVPKGQALQLCQRLLAHPASKLIGLAARDLLRLEAGLCLYGHEIDETTTPVEANLTWTIAKSRRASNKDAFPGWDTVIGQIKGSVPVPRKRIGLVSSIGPVPRQDTKVVCPETKMEIGVITSGSFSPALQKNVAMGYVPPTHTKVGQPLLLSIRNKLHPAEVAKLPFVEAKYYYKSRRH